MGAFLNTTKPALYPVQLADGTWTWCVVGSIDWAVGDPKDNWIIHVEEGLLTDLGSIPWLVRWLLRGDDPSCVGPFVLHDYILKRKGWLDGTWEPLFAVSQLYDAMKQNGVPVWKRKLIWLGVLFGIRKAEW